MLAPADGVLLALTRPRQGTYYRRRFSTPGKVCVRVNVAVSQSNEVPTNTSSSLPLHAHLVGIAGAGMRSLAEVLHGAGWRISGSDVNGSEGLPQTWNIFPRHAVENLLPPPDLVIASPAIAEDNLELAIARRLGIEVIRYPAMLRRLMAEKAGIAVAGTHGKSTTVAMLASIFNAANEDATVIVGAEGQGARTVSRYRRGAQVLVEACEYRSSFLQLRPRMAAILGIEPDHFDCFPSQRELEHAFRKFAALLPADGRLIARHECAATRRVATVCRVPVETFGFSPTADWYAEISGSTAGCYAFNVVYRSSPFASVRLEVPGRHNVLNATAACALAHHGGLSAEAISRGLSSFAGLRRRLEILGQAGGVTMVDDYAHHPTEIAAALQTVREMWPNREVFCVFEPHQASRTKSLLDELAASLQNADTLAVTEIFRAREAEWQPGEVTAHALRHKLAGLGTQVAGVSDFDEIEDHLVHLWQRGELASKVVLTLGAGRIGKLANAVYHRIRKLCSGE